VNRVVECVPNFSEGRRQDVVDAIVQAAGSSPQAFVLDCESDADHNRTVLTVAGAPEGVLEAVFRAVETAVERIDLTVHEGQHPRMGAADVVPFVPVAGVAMADCVALAEALGERLAGALDLPVFLYGEAARRDERRNLAHVRRGQFEGLRDAMGSDPDRAPDFGPNRVHPTAGATAVGARFFLVAYNVYLATEDVKVAKRIAREIRESSGGLPGVKALGLFIAERNLAQVSMNLVDYRVTSPARVVEVIREKARALGTSVVDTELVGLVPRQALVQSAAEALSIRGFSEEMVVEESIARKARSSTP